MYTAYCPYCNEENEFEFDEGFEDDEIMEVECSECDKTFGVRGFYVSCVDDEGIKMDCKNLLPCEFDGSRHMGDHTTRYCCTCGKDEVPRPNKPYPIPKEEQYHYNKIN